MKLSQSSKFNKEYCARLVSIKSFEPHPNPKCTGLKCAFVGGFSISVSLDTEPGWFIYFPIGSQIDGNYLSAMNLFRKAQMNTDPTKTGFFEDTRRVKPVKLQGYPSEGFLMPYESLKEWLNEEVPEPVENYDFDQVNDIILVKRYIIRAQRIVGMHSKGKDLSTRVSKLVEGQFRLHYDTDSLERMPWVVKPWHLIHISTKYHGTSAISANILCKRPLKWYEKLIKLLSYNFKEPTVYDNIYSSRKVIKNDGYVNNNGYYGNDAFRTYANDYLKPYLTPGLTVYYEIVGFTTDGKAIQSISGVPMDYGCVPPSSSGFYEYGKNYRILIYRITLTDAEGNVHEFSAHEVQLWCKQNNLEAVKELYWGFAKDLYPELDVHAENWSSQFCLKLKNDKERFYMELDSPDCSNSVPHEGIVIRIDDGKSAAFKVKSRRFLFKEDKDYEAGVANIEDQELDNEANN